jgi:uncharacterized protein
VKPPEQAVADAAVALGRALRETGANTSVDEELVLYEALAEIDMRSREQVYWAARSSLVRGPEQVAAFDRIFARFWAGEALDAPRRVSEHGESDPRMRGPQHGGESLPQYRLEGVSGSLVDGGINRASREIPAAGTQEAGGGERRGYLAAYSPAETLTERRPLDYAQDELAAVRLLGAELRAAMPQRRSRRLVPVRGRGRPDLRRTLRRSLATDGEPMRLARAGRSLRPRRLLLLCDVSGSMDRYSRLLLASLKAAVGAGGKAEAFVFATRLTRLTRQLSEGDPERALEQARGHVVDWSGGTRIGSALACFNSGWGRRGLARGAIVVIVSDGWDRGDPELLVRELRRLQLQSRRLVWVNPRPTDLDRQPLAVGMRAALPHVDTFVAGHDPRAIAGLAGLIGGLDPTRPARRRPALSSLAP